MSFSVCVGCSWKKCFWYRFSMWKLNRFFKTELRFRGKRGKLFREVMKMRMRSFSKSEFLIILSGFSEFFVGETYDDKIVVEILDRLWEDLYFIGSKDLMNLVFSLKNLRIDHDQIYNHMVTLIKRQNSLESKITNIISIVRTTFPTNKIDLSINAMTYTWVLLANLGQFSLVHKLIGERTAESPKNGFYIYDLDLIPHITETRDIINTLFSLVMIQNYDKKIWRILWRNLSEALSNSTSQNLLQGIQFRSHQIYSLLKTENLNFLNEIIQENSHLKVRVFLYNYFRISLKNARKILKILFSQKLLFRIPNQKS